jgi:hypothetical protein
MGHVFEGVVEVDLLEDLILVLEQSDEFIALGLTFDAHHDGVAGVAGEVVEEGVSGELYLLEILFITVVAADLYL